MKHVALKGAATLKERSGCKNRLNGAAPVMPIEDNPEVDFDFEKYRSMLAIGAQLSIETPDGLNSNLRSSFIYFVFCKFISWLMVS